jgi:DNA replication licensing factor MCM5
VALNSKEHPKMLRDLDASLVGKLVVIPGIVTAASKPIVKAKTIVAQCKGCQNRIQLKVGPGFGGLDLPRNCNVPRQSEGLQTDKCPVDPYVVVPEDCNFENMQTLKLQEAPEMIPTGEMPRAYTVTCSNKLVDTC